MLTACQVEPSTRCLGRGAGLHLTGSEYLRRVFAYVRARE
jgi:hypothetical protein